VEKVRTRPISRQKLEVRTRQRHGERIGSFPETKGIFYDGTGGKGQTL